MTMAISLPVKKQLDKFLKLFGAVERRIEIEGVVIEHSTPELGFDFSAALPEFPSVRTLLLPEEMYLAEFLSAEEFALFKLVEKTAQESGFEVEIEKPEMRLLEEGERIVPLVIEARKDFSEMLAASFEERNTLPPASKETGGLFGLFEKTEEDEFARVEKRELKKQKWTEK